MEQSTTTTSTIECFACHGVVSNERTCEICGSAGELRVFENLVLYWGKRLDKWHVAHDRLMETGKNILLGLILILSLSGKLFLVWYFADAANLSELPLSTIWYSAVDARIALGWMSFGLDLYLLYFLTTALDSKKKITKLSGPQEGKEGLTHIDISSYTARNTVGAIEDAWSLADKYHQPALLPFHIFTSLLDTSPIKILFARLGISYEVLSKTLARQFAEKKVQQREDVLQISSETREILIEAFIQAYTSQKEYLDETSLLETIASRDTLMKEVLYDLDVDTDKLKNVVQWVDVRSHIRRRYSQYRQSAHFKPKGSMDRAMTAVATPFLDRYSSDLTHLAKLGYLDLTIGRDDEFEQLFRLFETGKPGVVLVGPSGVGKTSMLYGLAQFMVEERVPKILQDKRLINLDAARLVSGATASTAAERLLKIADEIAKAGNIVLAIENVNSLIGISTGAEESMDLIDVLGSIIGKKQFTVIATSEPIDYQGTTTQSTLGQVFKILRIDEPSENLAIQILEAKTMVLEYKHKVFFSYDAIAELISLSFRYLPEEYMPAKAIALLEEIALYKKKNAKEGDTVVRVQDVATIVSARIKIPVSDVSQKESDVLLQLEELIHKQMIDQEQAVSAVAEALRRARAELTSGERPIANFLFLGPTGVGKTQLAKSVADVYFGSATNMVRLDMSEYQDASAVDKLIGKAGSSGHLTKEIKAQPFCILLLDELEKAHPDILNLFLQVMDDGRLTDGTGRTVDFTHVILIATSNAGSQYIQDSIKKSVPVKDITSTLLSGELRSHFKPEFLNRFDGVIVFKPLSAEDVIAIARLMVNAVKENLEEKHGIILSVEESGLQQLAKIGFQPEFGARPMRRAIQDSLDNPLATLILQKKVRRRDTVVYTTNGLKIIKAKPL